MEIRPARPADGPAVIELICALAEYEKLEPPEEAAQQRLLEHAFADPPTVELWVASLDGSQVDGYAATFTSYSTFRALPSLYLEDLFVHPRARRHGLGTAMMEYLLAEARRRGCGRFEWTVLDWNSSAQQFYRGLGANMLEAWRIMRVDL